MWTTYDNVSSGIQFANVSDQMLCVLKDRKWCVYLLVSPFSQCVNILSSSQSVRPMGHDHHGFFWLVLTKMTLTSDYYMPPSSYAHEHMWNFFSNPQLKYVAGPGAEPNVKLPSEQEQYVKTMCWGQIWKIRFRYTLREASGPTFIYHILSAYLAVEYVFLKCKILWICFYFNNRTWTTDKNIIR